MSQKKSVIFVLLLTASLYWGNQMWRNYYEEYIVQRAGEGYKTIGKIYQPGSDFTDYKWEGVVEISCGTTIYEQIEFFDDSTARGVMRSFSGDFFIHIVDFLNWTSSDKCTLYYDFSNDTLRHTFIDSLGRADGFMRRGIGLVEGRLRVDDGRIFPVMPGDTAP